MERFDDIARKVSLGDRISEDDALYLFEQHHDLISLGALAQARNYAANQDVVFYNINRHINPTNICALSCKFCAYSRKLNEPGAYAYSIETMVEKAGEAVAQGATEVHMVGGLHPRWNFDHYVSMIKAVKDAFPSLHIKAFTAVELDWLARKSRKTVGEVLELMREVGLGSLPGGGAEIFHPDIRDQICDTKVTAEKWLDTHRTAHKLGLHSNATMLYGHIEKPIHRVDHMSRLRDLQDETHGFNAFIPLAFQPFQNEMGISRYTLGTDDLKTLAIARIFLDNFKHIKAYWIMLSQDIAQIALHFGANDLDGTVIEEKISRMAGGRAGMAMSRTMIKNLIQRAGRIPVERDTLYKPLEVPERTTVLADPPRDAKAMTGQMAEVAAFWARDTEASKRRHRLLQDGLPSKAIAALADIAEKISPLELARMCREKQDAASSKSLNSDQTHLSLELRQGFCLTLECPPLPKNQGKKSADTPLAPQVPFIVKIKSFEASTPLAGCSQTQAKGDSLREEEWSVRDLIAALQDGASAPKAWPFGPVPKDSDSGTLKTLPEITIDLSGLCDHAGIFRSELLVHLKPLVLSLRKTGYPIHIAALKTLLRLCQPSRESEQEMLLLDMMRQFSEWGITSIQSSKAESETDLTGSEITSLHRTIRQSGLSSTGKLELVAPSFEGTVVLGESRPMWEGFLKRAEILSSLVPGSFGLFQVRVEVAPQSFVTPVDYLKAVALARLVLPLDVRVVAPFASIPTLSLAKGEGSQSYQHPAEKMAALVASFGAQSLDMVDGHSISVQALADLLEVSGVTCIRSKSSGNATRPEDGKNL